MDSRTLKEMLSGATLVLQDDETLESFRFHAADDGVAASLGTRGGPVCGPLLHYRVSDDAKVLILDDSTTVFTWEKVDLSGDVLTAVCEGRLKRFSYTASQRRERYLP